MGPTRFAERVAIVTGATSGIGRATAVRLGSEGARVVVVGRNEGHARETETLARVAGAPDVWISLCDVGDESQVLATTAGTLERWGRLDVVVNNAGMMLFKSLEEHTEEDWLQVLRVDLLGAFFFLKQAFLHMQSGGAVVNVSSVHAEMTTPLVASYAAAKAAVVSLTRSGGIEGKAKGIRVNCLLPGAIDTPMLWDNPNIKSGAEKIEPEDVGKPEDVAAAVAFLASPEAAFIQGSVLRVDGGRLSQL